MAPKFSYVISRLNVEYGFGLSGTPSRKDGRYVLAENLVGPILYIMKVPQVKPRVRLVRTEYSKADKNVPWVNMVSYLENNTARLKLIAKYAIHDAQQGHMVLIPLVRVKAIKKLVAIINGYQKVRAYPFWGGLKKTERDKTIEMARQYKARIIVGNSKLISTGINIPRASAIYDVTPSSNLENCTQRVTRVLTPWKDKPQPLWRLFLDDMNVRRCCMNNEWWNCMAKYKPDISEKDTLALKAYLAPKRKEEVLEFL